MSEALEPVFQIQRVYLKEASLEQPNSPAILLVQEQPTVDIQLGVSAEPAAEGVFVCHRADQNQRQNRVFGGVQTSRHF
jgi:preprotein translocase subunit SecB